MNKQVPGGFENLAMLSEPEFRDLIVDLVGRYAESFHQPRPFTPGESAVPVSGKVYGASDMQMLTHSALDFWTQGILAYFDAAGQGAAPHDAEHPIATREALRAYDPGLFALVHETMAYGGRVDWRLGR